MSVRLYESATFVRWDDSLDRGSMTVARSTCVNPGQGNFTEIHLDNTPPGDLAIWK